ncbi:GNAT family N-acetyltransferase [Aequorivita sp. CIP111184]|uniref:GNAT family N-acetyltransferase n=1 Tax=Aequorivita sp. CIP111184 TaxID=2211356 RepID=UPI000DBBBDC1|nr:GNAT family N-acetyltransferase [Aequorivita sp. CIP111184]SRX54777.1 hypothetical protein AEQU1_01794 [Aequorivita sp. CIP111184]
MIDYSVKKYEASNRKQWDEFIDSAKNATFLFKRDFMDYHKDRFEDYSLMVYKGEELYAVMPANRRDTMVYSHQGLTYGGFVLQSSAKLISAFEAFKAMLQFLSSNGISKLDIRIIPSFYSVLPSDELIYFLFLANATLIKRDVLFLIDYQNKVRFQKNRREGINKANRMGLEVKMDTNFDGFWNEILIPNLKNKHDVAPVHTLSEIKLLADRFPENIKQFSVYKDGKIVAGTTIFLTKTTVHPQYVSGNADKNIYGSLDLAYNFIIEKYKDSKRYFDFNISSEENGKYLNKGLVFWKESCGARSYTVDNYVVDTKIADTLTLNLL